MFHRDRIGDEYADIVALACENTGGPSITTNFCVSPAFHQQSTETGSAHDVLKVRMEKGDLLLFRNKEVMHGRANPDYTPEGQSLQEIRAIQNLDMTHFRPANAPKNWVEQLQARAPIAMGPASK